MKRLLPLMIALLFAVTGCVSPTTAQEPDPDPETDVDTEAQDESDEPEEPEEPEPDETDDEERPEEAYDGPGYDQWLSNFDYPHEVELFEFEDQRQQLEMAYMDVHPRAPIGETVVLFHGKNFSGAYWEDTIDGLLERGYHVIVPDQIGFGKSTKPVDFQFSLHTLAHHTKMLLDELDVDSAHVVGHSMGGMLATRFSLTFPDHTDSLSMVNPIGLEDYKRMVPYQPVDFWYESALDDSPESVREYMRQAYFDGQWHEEYDELVDLQAGWTEGPDHDIIAWISALTFDMIFTQPVLYEFDAVDVPTLLIMGQRDRTALGRDLADQEIADTMGDYPELGRRTDEAIADAQLVELDDIGHVPQYEDFEAYFEALSRFLELQQ